MPSAGEQVLSRLQSQALHAEALATIQRLLTSRVAKAQLRVFNLGNRAAALDIGFKPAYDPRALAFVSQFEYRSIHSLTARQAAKIQAVTLDGIRRGLNERDTLDAIRRVVGDNAGRVRAIARTEMNRAANWGRFSGWKSSGVVRYKEVLATHDERVREDHLEADGDRVPLDEPFTRGAAAGFQMPPFEPNCRCTAVPVTRFRGLAALPKQAVTMEVHGLRDAELDHTRDLLLAWNRWPQVFENLLRSSGVLVV